MPSETDRQIVRQGWLQVGIQSLVILAAIAGMYFKLEARADNALEKASNAEAKAATVENRVNDATIELTRIRTILEERLPKKGG